MKSAKSKLSGGILIIFLVISLVATFSIALAQEVNVPDPNADPDGDGLVNADDNCPNSHGGTNSIDGCPDTDDDGVANHEDTFPNDGNNWHDSDNDGIGDCAEGRKEGTPSGKPACGDGSGHSDSDGDLIPDYLDDDSDGDDILDFVEGDEHADSDGIPNYLDDDSDGDGILDSVEGDEDADADGTPNFLDLDSDGDGIPDSVEGDKDDDDDETPNFLDLDSDGDGLADINEGDENNDNDDIPDYLDTDSDDDEIEDGEEVNTYGTNPDLWDTDGDGLSDGEEITLTYLGDPYPEFTSDPLDTDTDDDGLSDLDEAYGFFYCTKTTTGCQKIYTDPSNADSDGDGISDKDEVMVTSTDPHITNPNRVDTDGDTINDNDDNCPNDSNFQQEDPDGDGIGEACDPIEFVLEFNLKDNLDATTQPFLFNEEITFSVQNSFKFGEAITDTTTGSTQSTVQWTFPDGTIGDKDGSPDDSFDYQIDVAFSESGTKEIIVNLASACDTETFETQQDLLLDFQSLPLGTCEDSNIDNPVDCVYAGEDWTPRTMPDFGNILMCGKVEEKFEIEITNGIYAVISKPTAGITIQPNQQLIFEEDSYSTGETIDSWVLDLGDESQPYGYLSFDQQYKCYSSTVATQFCSTNILTLGGNYEDGAACGCGDYTTEIFPTTTIDITNFAGRKTGHTYNSLEACGEDFICTVTLTVGADEDDDGTIDFTSSTTLDLPFNEVSVCSEFPDASICIAGELNLDDVCERSPELETCLDDVIPPDLNITSGNFTNETKNLDTLDPKIGGQENYVSKKPAKKQQYNDPLDNMKNAQGTGTDEKDKGSSGTGTILVIIILISALGGVGFFLWKKGMLGGSKPEAKSESFEATPTTAEPEPAKEEKPDSGSEIQAYVDKAKAAGETEDQMKEGLKAAGWPDSEIKKYL